MSEYYTAKRVKGLYKPGSAEPFRVSRSKIELFMDCPRCFYMDRRLGIGRPPGYPYTLNSAVDHLLKKEFDVLREAGRAHPLMIKYGVDAVPARHDMLNEWRNSLKGVSYHHRPTNLVIFGAIDDLWVNTKGEYIVVDYKSTAKNGDITALDEAWHDAYKRQMEIYQWLVRRNDLNVSGTGYFVYCNGMKDAAAFDGRLEFYLTLIPYKGSDRWIEGVVNDIHATLEGGDTPEAGEDCAFCEYRDAAGAAL